MVKVCKIVGSVSLLAVIFGFGASVSIAQPYQKNIDTKHVIHSANRDDEFRGVEMSLDLVDTLAERQKTVMNTGYKSQYSRRGFDLNYLPEITYDTAIMDLSSGKKLGLSVFSITTITQAGAMVDEAVTIYGFAGDTYHKILCNGVTNPYLDPGCLKKVQEVFGPITPDSG